MATHPVPRLTARALFPALAALLLTACAPPATHADADEGEVVVIHVYGGIGTPDRVEVAGRVLYAEPGRADSGDKGALENLFDNISALESDEISGAPVTVQLGGRAVTTRADEEGIFRVEFAKIQPPLASGSHPVLVSAEDPGGKAPAGSAEGRVFVVGPEVKYGIISDIDDTVVVSDVTRKLLLLANTFLKNAESATPVAGKARLYQLLAPGGTPFFYVSGSPMALHPRLEYYLALHGFPPGTLVLKNLGDDPLFDQMGFKPGKLGPILERFPQLTFLCFGDDGEKDPEVYDGLTKKYPGRVRHISIRICTGARPDDPRFPGMVAGSSAFTEARGLVEAGLLTEPQALEVARAILGDKPLPEGFSLASELPEPQGPAVETCAVDAQDVWDNFFRFLSQNWRTWIKMIGLVLVWAVIGTLAGGALGFVLGLLGFWKVRSWGWTRTGFSWYRYVGWMMPCWFAFACVVGFGWSGLYVGAGHRVKAEILTERFVQRTLIQLAIAMLATADSGAKLGDLTETAAKTESGSGEFDRALDGKVQDQLDGYLKGRSGAGFLERWTLRLLGRVTLRTLREKPEFAALRGAVLFTDEEMTRALEEDPEKAVAMGHAALRPLLLKLDEALAGYVSTFVWSTVAISLLLTLLAALTPVGILRLADRWAAKRRGTAGLPPAQPSGPA